MKSAKRRGRDEELAFRGFHGYELHVEIALGSLIDLGSQIVGLSCFCLKRHGRADALGRFLEGAGLPIRADLMIAGIHGKEKIRFALGGHNPCAIDPYPHGGAALDVLEDVSECFSRIWRGDGVLLAVRLYVKLARARAAATASRNRWGMILRKAKRRESHQENACNNGFLHDHLDVFWHGTVARAACKLTT